MTNRTTICLAALLTACAFARAGAQTRRSAAPPSSQAVAVPAPPGQRPQSSTQPPSQPTPETSSQAAQISEEEADLAIIANVTASSLRFEAVPNVSVEFPGRPRRETVWEAERTNLPRPVQPGVTYRDVGVRLKIVSVFADIDRIVAEALGEVPPSDDQPRPDVSRPDAAPPAGDATSTERAAATNHAADRRVRASASRRTSPTRRQR